MQCHSQVLALFLSWVSNPNESCETSPDHRKVAHKHRGAVGHSGTAVVNSWPAVHRIAGSSHIGRPLILSFRDALDVHVLGCGYGLVSQDTGVGFRDAQEARSEEGNGVRSYAWAHRLKVQHVIRQRMGYL